MQDECSQFPMIIPSAVAAYNSVYNEDHLLKKGATLGSGLGSQDLANNITEDALLLLSSISSDRMCGYATCLLEYLVDATKNGPQATYNGRTALYGLQTPPWTGLVSFLRCENATNLDRLIVF